MVEDVITRAGAVLHAVKALRAAGAEVSTVLCAIDREQDGRANLAMVDLELRALLTRTNLETAAPPPLGHPPGPLQAPAFDKLG